MNLEDNPVKQDAYGDCVYNLRQYNGPEEKEKLSVIMKQALLNIHEQTESQVIDSDQNQGKNQVFLIINPVKKAAAESRKHIDKGKDPIVASEKHVNQKATEKTDQHALILTSHNSNRSNQDNQNIRPDSGQTYMFKYRCLKQKTDQYHKGIH
jgi:hypothetical protein